MKGATASDLTVLWDRVRRFPRAAAWISSFIALLVLAGWAMNAPALTSGVPGFAPMVPWTAVNILLLGLALFERQRAAYPAALTAAERRRALGLTLVSIAVSTLMLTEYAAHWGSGLDLLFFKSNVLSLGGVSFPGRTSPHTALSFLFIGAGLLTVRSSRELWTRLGRGLLLVTVAISLMALVGHVYGVTSLYGISRLIGMAVPTSMCIFLLATGTLALRPDRGLLAVFLHPGAGGLLIRRMLGVVVFMPILMALLIVLAQRMGWVDPASGSSLYVILTLMGFTSLISWTSTRIIESEEKRVRFIEAQVARQKAEEALRARDDFLSVVSHELKTPLTAIKLHVEISKMNLARQGEAVALSVENMRPLLAHMDGSVVRLSRLVDDLLDLSRLNSSKMSLHFEEFDLSVVLSEIVQRLAFLMPQNKSPLPELRISSPIVGTWDRFRIEQVISNLLINAARYGSGRPIVISAREDGGYAEIRIKDQGIGIDKKDQERIFERFERAISANEVSGLGLGLYITRQILALHGGTVTVTSELGRGSEFTVRLPRRANAPEASSPG